MAGDAQERIAPHRMLPILVEDDSHDLVAAVANHLRRMVGPDEVDDDIVPSLLRHKRLLIIVDALSERSQTMQEHVQSIAGLADVNSLVITSRREPDFGPVPVATLWPERIALSTLVGFVLEYLRVTGAEMLFPGRDALHLADRLMGVVERSSPQLAVTPLLVTLFIGQAAALRRAGAGLEEMPVSTPDVILDYIRRTNPHDPNTPNRVPDDAPPDRRYPPSVNDT